MFVWILNHANVVSGKESMAWIIRTRHEITHSLSVKYVKSSHHSHLWLLNDKPMHPNLSLSQNLAIFVCPNPSTRSSCGPMTNSSLFQASDLDPPDMNPCPLTPLTPPRLLSRRCSVAKGVDIYIKCKSFSIRPSTIWSKETFIFKKKSKR